MKLGARVRKKYATEEWTSWFAWRPVRVQIHGWCKVPETGLMGTGWTRRESWVWLETVQRKGVKGKFGYFWRYRVDETQAEFNARR